MKSGDTSNFNVSSLIQTKVQKDKTKKMFFKSYLTLGYNFSNKNKILLEYLPAYLEKKCTQQWTGNKHFVEISLTGI